MQIRRGRRRIGQNKYNRNERSEVMMSMLERIVVAAVVAVVREYDVEEGVENRHYRFHFFYHCYRYLQCQCVFVQLLIRNDDMWGKSGDIPARSASRHWKHREGVMYEAVRLIYLVS
jgi:hypothetical protein